MQDILLDIENRVARIRFNRPKALNALTPGLLTELSAAFDRAIEDDAVRAILLAGEGRAFCSGADLGTLPPRDAQGRLDLGLMLERHYNPLVLKMRACPKPIVSAVNGLAAGAGCSLALMADLTIAARSAYFLQAFVNIGLVPDAGATWLLPRLVGPQRAAGMAMLGEKLPAEKAQAWGLIWEVVDDDQLLTTATALAQKLADGPGVALARIKQLQNATALNGLSAQLDLERELQRECGHSEDSMEGVLAFMQKRKPNYKNR
ncbi:MAG: enoyl-CoA hydratase-related protein [Pseudomonadota bacterium]